MYIALFGACTHKKFTILVLIGVSSQVLLEIAAFRILPPSRASWKTVNYLDLSVWWLV
jgi:hypothetical protein